MGNDIYIVAKLLKKRKHEGKIEYLVQWFGCSKDKNSWEPESHILDKNLIKEFDARESCGHTSCSRCVDASPMKKIVKDEKLDEMLTLGKYVINKTNISITNADINCLAPGAFLNDTIIDFYCNYLLEYYLKTPEQKDRVYLFNSFFYKTYTQVRSVSTKSQTQFSKPIEGASNGNGISKSKKRHKNVERWTKRVNLFEKDFIFIPVNEKSHWFLLVICFPQKADHCTVGNGKYLTFSLLFQQFFNHIINGKSYLKFCS